ncbi:MAG: IMP cyclohydrolase [Nitrospirae bacterium CG_4_10_14_3_um_filter_44_29]|nr:IMP cyclohydrolase [Nitrospirota bacterium]OIO29361.1 MAG: IMP cyclohydrolase [Nitrospirae bacterium CG1_02_44_142]PIP70602.1 MAG: IMP cyclohydrolase [Nitrospirae bacterium CG22_combo_CG10-13_8_21_14_all_44_11]PIV41558.1 MAG: IMP cyclohydrolase [Nitrospirae bacterium CG02_land_8_20_14_3_00_44_33]PIV66317.1 MAG: IMP cyclohydrolase [Nitrospirae bacterium CG01_land_8_20_14_3_00_44_22]PIW89526.1 MAG: IMP cyclohydrolase [Nitrospirae bacterium CG_4_8_14_3_um_filter_44_28]PIX87515.1 MAG: IMP cycl
MSELKKMYRTIMDDNFPDDMTIKFGGQALVYKKRTWKIPNEKTGELIEKGLRYGENPDQQAALYELVSGNLILGNCQYINPGSGLVSSIAEEDMIQAGKHPGKINMTDLDNALNIMKYLMDKPAAVILKHNNPCGAAYGKDIADAYNRANMADRIAAFGGCLVVNRAMDIKTAEMVNANYLEVVAAPDFEEGAVEILAKRKNLRIIRVKKIDELSKYRDFRFVEFKSLIDGGIIVQQSPMNRIRTKNDFLPAKTIYKGREYIAERAPTDREYEDMLFGWNVEQGITSNSVIYVKDGVTVGIGTGEQDRVGVAEIAVFKAYTKYADALCFKKCGIPYKTFELEAEQGKRDRKLLNEIDEETKRNKGGLIGSVMVSDAFFPFRDGIDAGIKQGVAAVVQPGGSERDFEVIEACNEAEPKVAMVFTGQRAFKH